MSICDSIKFYQELRINNSKYFVQTERVFGAGSSISQLISVYMLTHSK